MPPVAATMATSRPLVGEHLPHENAHATPLHGRVEQLSARVDHATKESKAQQVGLAVTSWLLAMNSACRAPAVRGAREEKRLARGTRAITSAPVVAGVPYVDNNVHGQCKNVRAIDCNGSKNLRACSWKNAAAVRKLDTQGLVSACVCDN